MNQITKPASDTIENLCCCCRAGTQTGVFVVLLVQVQNLRISAWHADMTVKLHLGQQQQQHKLEQIA